MPSTMEYRYLGENYTYVDSMIDTELLFSVHHYGEEANFEVFSTAGLVQKKYIFEGVQGEGGSPVFLNIFLKYCHKTRAKEILLATVKGSSQRSFPLRMRLNIISLIARQ